MVSKEVSCTISQFIYDDILDSFEAKGIFSQLSRLSLAASPRIFFLCRFPSMINTVRFSRNLFIPESTCEGFFLKHCCLFHLP